MPDHASPATLARMADTPILVQIRELYQQRQTEGWTIPQVARAAGVANMTAYRVIEQEADCMTDTAYKLLKVLKHPPPRPPDHRRRPR